MQITLNLIDGAAQDYAGFHGYQAKVPTTFDDGTPNPDKLQDNEQTVDQFITDRLVALIQNDLVEQRSRQAIADAQNQPAPLVTDEQVADESSNA